MTGVPPPSLLTECPLPPADLHARRIPTRVFDVAGTPLLRVHRTEFTPLFFNRRSRSSTVYRFDAPDDEYGVLYASAEFDVCMAETLIRNRFESGPLLLDHEEISSRSISALGLSSRTDLTLVDLTMPLFPVGGNAEIASTSDYTVPNRWSKAFYDHPAEYDGLYFYSRYTNMPSVALFDRVDVTVERTTALLSDPRLSDFLDRYEIGVI
jgi:hypothetical protein